MIRGFDSRRLHRQPRGARARAAVPRALRASRPTSTGR